eukprot:TRINITY_DN307_c2_g5_i1.p1 TRINITY_DN307_c2_g5~~TRINITY_DN307_c2_g5_i1.p1  ORF type:complete len:1977 (+),score=578.12 TRINITY_DN307_c2_g5_i1:155-5932(+)
MRVFHDRLSESSDRQWLISLIRDMVDKHFKLSVSKVLEEVGNDMHRIVWNDLTQSSTPIAPNNGRLKLSFAEVEDEHKLKDKLTELLADYNEQNGRPLDLVLFPYAILHLTRLLRVLQMPGGNMLLVGMTGLGKQSLVRLAAFILDMKLVSIEITKTYGKLEWEEDLRKLLLGTGADTKEGLDQGSVFLFSDAQIKWEGMMENVNSLLSGGNVPNLFNAEDRIQIRESLQPFLKTMNYPSSITPDEAYNVFLKRIQANLHVCLCVSPIGNRFRERVRKFPALVNNCSIDWYTAWPTDGLLAVGHRQLQTLRFNEDDGDIDDDTDKTADEVNASEEANNHMVSTLVDICRRIHASAESLSIDFKDKVKRHVYVTSSDYLQLLSLFQSHLADRRREVVAARSRYENGLSVLDAATRQITEMEEELTALGPVLKASEQQTADLMKVIQDRMPGVEETRRQVKSETNVAEAKAAEVNAMKEDCAADLAKALPALDAAIKALNTLKPSDIANVKAMSNPPAGVKLVMESVCIMFQIRPDKIKDPEGGLRRVDDFWGPSKKLLGDIKFLDKMKTYDKDNIAPKIMNVIRKKYIPNPDFMPDVIAKASSAAEGMCRWVRALDQYDQVAKEVAPKQAALQAAQETLDVTMAALKEKQDELAGVESELEKLQNEHSAANEKKRDCQRQTKLCATKLGRAEQLMNGLGDERARWESEVKQLNCKYESLTGDVLISAAVLAYLGPYTSNFREEATTLWRTFLVEERIPCSEDMTLKAVLGDEVLIRQWHIDGLPRDEVSIENAISVTKAARFPLMIDPQGQANQWIKAREVDNNLQVTKLADETMLRTMENAVQFGQPVLLEGVLEELDPALDSLLAREVFRQGGVDCIKLGDTVIEYSSSFKLYITTKHPNPHFLPEIASKVTLLNFMITPTGLQDQLLSTVVAQERPDLETKRNDLIVEMATNQKQLRDIESRILDVLQRAQDTLLEDESTIEVLRDAKTLALEISEKQTIAAETTREINCSRQEYQPVAHRGQVLFFCLVDMSSVDPMYHFALEWFQSLFIQSIKGCAKSSDLATRLSSLCSYFTHQLFLSTVHSLFASHKLLFCFLLLVRIGKASDTVDPTEYFTLLTGGTGVEANGFNPVFDWLSDKKWIEVCNVSQLAPFSGFREEFLDYDKMLFWKSFATCAEPMELKLPEQWNHLSKFQVLLIIRCLCPNKLVTSVEKLVDHELGPEFNERPTFDIQALHEASLPHTPIVFILSPGSDPVNMLLKYASDSRKKLDMVSLGQGQGELAEKLIKKAMQNGSWMLLQNCHLALSWLPTLERIHEELSQDKDVNQGFRLWLTTYSTPEFPISVLQGSSKVIIEAPKGLRANLLRSFNGDPINNPEFYCSVRVGEPWRRLLFGLCLFHGIVQERRQFGSIGWNIRYEFNESDLQISVQQLHMFLKQCVKPEAVPYDILHCLIGECNYGGRVTDERDRRLLMALLHCCFDSQVLEPSILLAPGVVDGHRLSPLLDVWRTPPASAQTFDNYRHFIESLPLTASPALFGLHDNADITKDQNEAADLFSWLLDTYQGSGGGSSSSSSDNNSEKEKSDDEKSDNGDDKKNKNGDENDDNDNNNKKNNKNNSEDSNNNNNNNNSKEKSAPVTTSNNRDVMVGNVVRDLLKRLPPQFDMEAVMLKYPVLWEESMNTVLCQELKRFNRLLLVIRETLVQLDKSIDGLVVMSAALEQMRDDVYLNRVPSQWNQVSYPSLKPLSSYIADLIERCNFFSKWIKDGQPSIFWISGFFFTHSFLTGVLQNYARKLRIPIDTLCFDFDFINLKPGEEYEKPPENGAYVNGLFLEGCGWDSRSSRLTESDLNTLFTSAPCIWLKPCLITEQSEYSHYVCPVYKTSARRGTLSTTGHSTNFIMDIRMPSSKSQDHWVLRGVAMLTQLDD